MGPSSTAADRRMESPPVPRTEVDMNLYSRQLGTLGLETMTKLVTLRVLISGLQGTGVEIAKNLILAGPGAVTVHDDTIVDFPVLGSNFYLNESDVGVRTNAEGSMRGLATLNSYVEVNVHKGAITEDVVRDYRCVVLCNYSRDRIVEVNRICRRFNVALIAVGTYGLCCSMFNDFGPEFMVVDGDGEEPKRAIVESIISMPDQVKVIVNCVDDKKLPFSVGDFVAFSEIEGMVELNHAEPQKISSIQKHSFEINLRHNGKLSPYTGGGIVHQIKRPKVLHFRSYAESCDRPVPEEQLSLITPDLAKFGRSEQLHIILQSLLQYEAQHHCIPEPRDPKAVEEIYAYATELNQKYAAQKQVEGVIYVEEVDKHVVKNVVDFALCHLSPIATFIGSVAAQEIIKLTGKYTPVHQWLYFDAFEIVKDLEVNDWQTTGSRYDDQIIVWGKTVQERLAKMNIFLVGAGALGCEYMKNLAMMGCCTKGLLTITDMDRIEVSNLNRQFLFRPEHVNKPKSSTAAQACKQMNPELRIRSIEIRVGPETETVLTDDFWESQDLIINALDNVPTRLYVDGKCVWHLKPLLESGTLGTKGNIQVVVPKMTESYGDARDPPEESIPLCTLRHFPNQIEHTIEWARDLFQGLFHDAVQEIVSAMRASSQGFDGTIASIKLETNIGGAGSRAAPEYEKMLKILKLTERTISFDNCVAMAVELFNELFYLDIAQLLHNFPLDHVTSSGTPFWSGPKRAPRVLRFDTSDPTHLSFVRATANVLAACIGLPPIEDLDKVAAAASQVPLEPFRPRQVHIKASEEESDTAPIASELERSAGLEQTVKRLLVECMKKEIKFVPIEFEKDNDENYHIDFTTAAGNLRARNYKIAEIDRWKAKIIAGKIIPAIATTTAMVTGLASIELIKLATIEHRSNEHFKNAFVNLAIPTWVLSEPIAPKRQKDIDYDPIVGGPVRAKPSGFTSWDKIEVDMRGSKTVGDLVKEIERRFDTEVSILSVGNLCLYNSFGREAKERLNASIVQVLERLAKSGSGKDQRDNASFILSKTYAVVQACCTDADGTDVNVPSIKCILT